MAKVEYYIDDTGAYVDAKGRPLKGRKLKKAQSQAKAEKMQDANEDLAAARQAVNEVTQEQRNRGVDARLREQKKMRTEEQKKAARKLAKAKTVQEALGFEKVFEDGICLVRPGLYSQTIKFEDVGYQTARIEDQKRIFNRYCELLNIFDDDVHLQLNLINNPIPREQYNQSIFLHKPGDSNDHFVEEYNEMLASKSAEQPHTIDQQRYFTVTVNAESRAEAIPALASVTNDIREQLRSCGSDSHILDGQERAALLASQLIPDEEYEYDFARGFKEHYSVRDSVCPSSLDFKPSGSSEWFKLGSRCAEVLYIKEYPADLDDRFLSSLMELQIPINVTIHFTPMDHGDSIDLIRRKMVFMDQQRASEAKNAVRNGLDPSFVSSELLHTMDETNELLTQLRDKDQRMLFTSILIYVWGKDYDELDKSVMEITRRARKASVKLGSLDMRQRQGLASALPVGYDYSDVKRTLTTASAAIFMPFSAQELVVKGGIYGGQNNVTNNMIFYNRKKLKAPNGWVLGKPGRGKSFAVKREIFSNFINNPEDEFLIIDPQNEYGMFARAVGGIVYDIDPSSETYINPFDISDDYDLDGSNPVAFKSSFIMTMINSIVASNGSALSAADRTIIDRVVKIIYRDMRSDWTLDEMPTLMDFFEVLKQQPEVEAKRMVTTLELYTEGSLSCFTHHTNVPYDGRMRVFNTKSLPRSLQSMGMLIVLDQVSNRASYNYKRGVRTWLYVDEAQKFFESDYSIDYFDQVFSEGRKKLIIPTAITQNVDRVLKHDKARQMFSNSDFNLVLGQSDNDLTRHLVPTLHLSAKEKEWLSEEGSKPGYGLLICGASRILFRDEFPKGTDLYELFSTDPNEREERLRREREEQRIAANNNALAALMSEKK